MFFAETPLKGAFVIEIEKLEDERGFFGRSWCAEEMKAHGLNTAVCQASTSMSIKKGTLRGMHYQRSPHQETKLIRCTNGRIFDVIIDLRPESETYKKWFGVELSRDNYKMLYVPEDFAHGFITLEDDCEVTYLVTEYYSPGFEDGVRWDDPVFDIKWPRQPLIISEKDKNRPDYKN